MDNNIPLTAQIAELNREARVRRSVYPRWVADGKLTVEDANRQQERLQAAINTLEKLYLEREQLKLPL